MQLSEVPFNIELLIPSTKQLETTRAVSVLDIFEGRTKNFHPDGLFSVETFGRVGDQKRNTYLSFIDLKIDVLHPIIFKAVTDTKALYEDIMSSKTYCIWNADNNNFEKSNPVDGKTGYDFFMRHYKDIDYTQTQSAKREFNIKLLDMHKHDIGFSKMIVLPAGLRDYEIDENGKPTMDEINNLYIKTLSLANIIDVSALKTSSAYFDITRFNIQLCVNEVYEYFTTIVEGKSKFILGKWASRKIYNSTRNVITSHISNVSMLHGKGTVGVNQTPIGLYQFPRTILPLAVNLIRDTLSDVFVGPNSPTLLVDPVTLKKVAVSVDHYYYDSYMTYAGLEKLMDKFGQESLRHDPIMIGKYYLGLMYKGPDMTYRFVQDIGDLPSNRSKKDLTPITYSELIYLSLYKEANTVPGLLTRYPVTAVGSVYPTYAYLKTTNIAEQRKELGQNWELTGNEAMEFPIVGQKFFESLSPNITKLARLAADFDGDTVSYTSSLSDESRKEIADLLSSKKYYLDGNNGMNYSSSSDLLNLLLKTITGP